MKKIKLLKKILQLEATVKQLKEQKQEPVKSLVDSKKLDTIQGNVTYVKGEIGALRKENAELQKLVKQMCRSYTALLEKVGNTQSQVGEIRQLVTNLQSQDTGAAIPANNNPYATVYTDASMDSTTHSCGYAYVVVGDNDTVTEYSGIVEKLDNIKTIDIQYGEIYSIIKALEMLDSQYYSDVVLYTDNIIAVNWADIGDQADSQVAKWFYGRLQELKANMNITIMWMKRCTCEYNTRADQLAKMAMAENSFVMVQQSMDKQSAEEATVEVS